MIYSFPFYHHSTFTHHKIANDDGGEEERHADFRGDPHTVPHGL